MGFVTALSFLTILPLPHTEVSPTSLGRAVGYFPAVGVLIGGVLACATWVFGHLFPPTVAGALVLAVWVGASGALHVDGFLDACDGLFGGHTPEARLRIMRDERVGAFALVGGVLLLLTKHAAIVHLMTFTSWHHPVTALRVWIVAPTLGRYAMSLAVIAFPYARKQGLGRWMKDHAGGRELLLAAGTALSVSLLLWGVWGLLWMMLVTGSTWMLAHFTLSRIPGLTGDIYGALCEITELFVLLIFLLSS